MLLLLLTVLNHRQLLDLMPEKIHAYLFRVLTKFEEGKREMVSAHFQHHVRMFVWTLSPCFTLYFFIVSITI